MPSVGDLDRFLRYTIDERRTMFRKIRKITRAISGGGTVTGHHRTDRKL